MTDNPTPFRQSLRIRWAEMDAQGVVFNGWYLTYFDDAFTEFLAHRGLPYADLVSSGFDCQLVNSQIDWLSALRAGDDVTVAVSTARLGRTSFAVDFQTRRDDDQVTCSARTLYVVIATDGTGKRPIPPLLAEALGAPDPLRES